MCLLRLPQPIQKKTCRIGESPPVGIGHALQRHSSTFPAVFCRSRSLKHVCCKLTYCKWAFLNKSLITTCFLHYMLSEVRKWRLKRVWCTQSIPLSNKHYSNIIILYNVYIYNYIYIIIILEFHKPNRTPPFCWACDLQPIADDWTGFSPASRLLAHGEYWRRSPCRAAGCTVLCKKSSLRLAKIHWGVINLVDPIINPLMGWSILGWLINKPSH